MKALKYAQVFAIESRECSQCGTETTHWLALQSSNKQMKNAQRVRQCEKCLLITEAPLTGEQRLAAMLDSLLPEA